MNMSDPYGYQYAASNPYVYANNNFSPVNFPSPGGYTAPTSFPSPSYQQANDPTGFNQQSSTGNNIYHPPGYQQPQVYHYPQSYPQQHYDSSAQQHSPQHLHHNQQPHSPQPLHNNQHYAPQNQPPQQQQHSPQPLHHNQQHQNLPLQQQQHSPQPLHNQQHSPQPLHNQPHQAQQQNQTQQPPHTSPTQPLNNQQHSQTAGPNPTRAPQNNTMKPQTSVSRPTSGTPTRSGGNAPHHPSQQGRGLPTPPGGNTRPGQNTGRGLPTTPGAKTQPVEKPAFAPPPAPTNFQVDLDASTFFIDQRDPTGFYEGMVVNTKTVAMTAKRMLETILNNYSEISGNPQSASGQQVKLELNNISAQAEKLSTSLKNKCAECKNSEEQKMFVRSNIENLKDAIESLSMSCDPNVFEGQPTSSIETEKPTLLVYFSSLVFALKGILIAAEAISLVPLSAAPAPVAAAESVSKPQSILNKAQATLSNYKQGSSAAAREKAELHTIDLGTPQTKSKSPILTFRKNSTPQSGGANMAISSPSGPAFSMGPPSPGGTPTQILSGELQLVSDGLIKHKKKRYFQQKTNLIHYFNSVKDVSKPLGSIDILQISTVSPIENTGDEYGFEIKAKGGKAFTLYAGSDVERLKWITGLADWQMYLSTSKKGFGNRSMTVSSPAPSRPTSVATGQATVGHSNNSASKDPATRLKELQEKIPKEEKSLVGLEKLVGFYSKDPVGAQKAIEELKAKQQTVDALKKERQELEKQLGVEPTPTPTPAAAAPKVQPQLQANKADAILSRAINNSNLDGDLQEVKAEIQNLIKQKKQLADSKAPSGPGTPTDKLNKQINDLKNRKKQVLKLIEQSGGSVAADQDNDSSVGASNLGTVEVLYDFEAVNQGEMELRVGEIVTVEEEVGEWLRGSIGNRSGMFPKNYIRKIESNSSAPQKTPSSNVVSGFGGSAARGPVQQQTQAAPQQHQIQNNNNNSNESRVRALYDFEPMSANELRFSAGDEIVLVKGVDGEDWWTGTVRGHTGAFPANYVERLDISTQPSNNNSFTQAHTPTPQPQPQPQPIVAAPAKQPEPVAKDDEENVEKGKVIYDFEAGGPGEINVSAGSIVKIRKYVDDEWMIAEVDGEQGLIPIQYVEPLEEQVDEVGTVGKARVLYDFKPEKEGELDLKQGDVVALLYAPPTEDWWRGKLRGVEGVFPRNYVELS